MISRDYRDIVIVDNSFYIIKRERQSDDDEIGTLERIEKVLKEHLQYARIPDLYANLEKPKLTKALIKMADAHSIAYISRLTALESQRESSLFKSYYSWSASTKKQQITSLHNRIIEFTKISSVHQPSMILPNELISEVLNCSNLTTIGRFGCTNRWGKKLAKQALILRAKSFGYKGKSPKAAKAYLLSCFNVLKYKGSATREANLLKWSNIIKEGDQLIKEYETSTGKEILTLLEEAKDVDLKEEEKSDYKFMQKSLNIQEKLYQSVKKGINRQDRERVEGALRLGANPNQEFWLCKFSNMVQDKASLLHWAVYNTGNLKGFDTALAIVKLLLQYGADPNAISANGDSVLNYAFDSDEVVESVGLPEDKMYAVINVLLDAGADPAYGGTSSFSPIEKALKMQYYAIANLLTEYYMRRELTATTKADLDAKEGFG